MFVATLRGHLGPSVELRMWEVNTGNVPIVRLQHINIRMDEALSTWRIALSGRPLS